MPKRKAKSPQQLRKEALATIQKMVRLKAADDNGMVECVSCGVVKHWTEMQGGHYLPKGSSSYWALEVENVHPQCPGCNNFGMKHGDAAQRYTLYMVDTYGRDFVEDMHKSKRLPMKLYAAAYRDMIEAWKLIIKENLERLGE